MKIKLKKAIIPIFLSILIGCLSGKFTYNIYTSNNDLALNSNKIYLIQNGTYNSYDSMRANTISNDYIYYKENNLYKTVIGITKNKDNITKISNTIDTDVVINTYYLEDSKVNNLINEYDKELKQTNNKEEITILINKMLELYKEEDIKLVKMD